MSYNKRYFLGLVLFCLLGFENTLIAMQLPMQFNSAIDMKEFVKDNAHKYYFQGFLEGVQDPVTSVIMHNRVLEHAKNCLETPKFATHYFNDLPEGCFKTGARLLYCAMHQGKKNLDNIDVSIILKRLSNKNNINAGFVDFEGCCQFMPSFGQLLAYIFPLIEPLVLKNISILRLSSNQLMVIPGSIRSLQNLEKLCITDNLLTVLPNEMTQLPKLNYIDISRNKFLAVPQNIKHVKTIIWNNKAIRGMHFMSPADIKEFIKDNAARSYFQTILDGILDPETSIITHYLLLCHAKNFLMSEDFTPCYFNQLNEGSFKMALRLIYAATNNGKSLDDVNVDMVLNCASKESKMVLNLEIFDKKIKNFALLLRYAIPLIEPITKAKALLAELQNRYHHDTCVTKILDEITQLKDLIQHGCNNQS